MNATKIGVTANPRCQIEPIDGKRETTHQHQLCRVVADSGKAINKRLDQIVLDQFIEQEYNSYQFVAAEGDHFNSFVLGMG